ncbi:MAG: hypothetical protein R3F62_05235 [Planctomycetota bacterium]
MSDDALRRRERRAAADGLEGELALLRERARSGELTDAEHRVLELAAIWRESGDPRDEARTLAARLETHAVTSATLRLAARLGHAPAIEGLELAGREAPGPDEDVLPLLRSVVGSAPRLALAAGRYAYAQLDPPPQLIEEAQHLFLVLDAWNACPCAEHQELVDELAQDCRPIYRGLYDLTLDAHLLAPLHAALFATGPPGTSFGISLVYGLPHPRVELAVTALRLVAPGPELPAPIRDEVVPWLLGYGDPVDARAEL